MGDPVVVTCVVLLCTSAGALLAAATAGVRRTVRHATGVPWVGALAVAVATSTALGAVALLQPAGGTPRTAVVELREMALSVAVVLVVPAVDTVLRVPVSVPATLAVAVLATGRSVLWFWTDLVGWTSTDAAGRPDYGPAAVPLAVACVGLVVGWVLFRTATTAATGLPVVATGCLASVSMAAVGVAVLVVAGAGPLTDAVRAAWLAPVVAALLVLDRRRAQRDEAVRRRAESHQHALVRLGRGIVRDDLAVALARGCEVLRSELGVDAWIEVRSSDRVRVRTDVPLPAVDRAFVEGVTHLVEAVAARTGAERDSARARRQDPVTGLPNRTFALGRLTQLLADADVAADRLVVQVVHLEGLDAVRSVHGFEVADTASRQVARALQETIGTPHGWWHAGGDEYVAVSPWSHRTLTAASHATMRRELAAARRALGAHSRVRLGLGVVVAGPGASARALMHEAHVAAERAHASGGLHVAQRDLATQLRHRSRLEHALEHAVERAEIEVHYQPIVDPRDRSVHGVEALARWWHEGRLLPPGRWIGLAETTGLIDEIGLHVMRTACRERAAAGGLVSVNVSPVQLADPGIVEHVLDAAWAIPRGNLVLEVTESAIAADLDLVHERLETLRRGGVRIALDDFGTEHSSLARLSRLPFDIVKIDRDFVVAATEPAGRAVLAGVQAMARALGTSTIAEGIETPEQLAAVREVGVDLVQGFLLGRPRPTSTARPRVR